MVLLLLSELTLIMKVCLDRLSLASVWIVLPGSLRIGRCRLELKMVALFLKD